MNQICIYTTSEDSKEFHPNNSSSDFTVELPETLHLKGDWVIALTEIYTLEEISVPILILCDICEQSIHEGKLKPILKLIYPDCIQFSNIHYIPIKNRNINRIRFLIKDGVTGKDILSQKISLSLHLLQRQ